MPRQLTAIMFADMVGYTALMQKDERRAKLLRDRQREVLEARVAEFGGEIVQYYGDGALCGFQSAIQAVECAVAAQVDLREEPTVPVRIGIHLGDVAFDKTGVYGDGVNVAARIESLSVAGGVLVSGKIAEEVKNQPEIATEFLAEVVLKNVKDPQRVFAVTNADLVVPGVKEMKGWQRPGREAGGSGRGWVKWVVGVVTVAGAAGVYALASGRGDVPQDFAAPSPAQESIAILPFDYTGPHEEEDGWTGRGIVLQLSGLLESGVLLPVVQTSIQSLVSELREEGFSGQSLHEQVARRSGADLVLHGDISGAPDGTLSVNAYIFDPRSGETLTRVSEQGTVDGFRALVMELAREILIGKSGVDPTLRGDLLFTESTEALKGVIEGETSFRTGNYPDAVRLLGEAIKADPGLAYAHYRFSQASLYAWEWDDARTAAENAWGLRAELSGLHRQLLEAWRGFLISDPVSAEAEYRALFDDNRQNPEVLAGLGSVLVYFNSLQGRSSAEADFYFREALSADPNYGEVRYHVLEAAAQNGQWEAFDRWYTGLSPESDQALAFEAVRAFGIGDERDQQLVLQKAQDSAPKHVVYAAVRVAAFLHHFAGSDRLAALLLDSPRNRGYWPGAHALRASLAFAQGRLGSAERELDRTAELEAEWALEIRAIFALFLSGPPFQVLSAGSLRALRDSIAAWDPEDAVLPSSPLVDELFGAHARYHKEFRLFLLGLLSARLGDGDTAREFSDSVRLRGWAPESRGLSISLSQSIDAHVESARGNADDALMQLMGITYFPRFEFISASPFFSRALDRWLRGELLRESDRPEDALPWYNTLSDGWGEFLFAAPAHFRQAEIHEDLGNSVEAIKHYEKFISLWENADDELLPHVERARTAREALVSGGE